MNEKIGVFCDYYRIPKVLPKGIKKWHICRSDKEFTSFITEYYKEYRKFPEIISFSHGAHPEHFEYHFMSPPGSPVPYDKFENKTFLHSATWLGTCCQANNLPMDFKVCVHTKNAIGARNIQKVINSYKELLGYPQDCFMMDWKEYDYLEPNYSRYLEMKAKQYDEVMEMERLEKIKERLQKEMQA